MSFVSFASTRWRRALRLVISGVLLSTTIAGDAQASALGTTPVSPSFGVNAHLLWYSLDNAITDLDHIKAAGLTRVRYDLYWSTLQPARGAYDTAFVAKLDGVVAQAQARGIQSTIVLLGTPAWARNNAGSIFTPPANPSDFATAAAYVAARYKRVPGMAYEIWNEPNQGQFWDAPGGPNPAAYTRLLKAAYTRIKKVAPTAVVLGGSIAFNDQAFLQQMYVRGGARGSFDALAIHPYCLGYAPDSSVSSYDSFTLAVTRLQQTMASYGDKSKPIRITEMGWSTSAISDATRAAYFRQAVGMVKAWPSVVEFDAYALSQAEDLPDYGLVDAAGAATASWTAFTGAALAH